MRKSKKLIFAALIVTTLLTMSLCLFGCFGGKDGITPGDSGGGSVNQPEDKTPDLSGVATEYTLTAGHYTAGIDLPQGKCDVTWISGSGNVSSTNLLAGGINAIMGEKNADNPATDYYIQSYKNLTIGKDVTLSLSMTVKVKLTYKELKSNLTRRIYDDSKALELAAGNYTSAEIPAGTYKIVAVSGNGNISSSNLLDNGINAIMGISTDEMYTTEFYNFAMKADTTVGITMTLNAKFIPAK